METNRRDFIKVTGVVSAGMITGGLSSCNKEKMPFSHIKETAEKPHKQIFNMSGYGAPKLETVRIGIIGIGNRGMSAVERLKLIEGVEIKALCDLKIKRAEKAQKVLIDYGLPSAETYGGNQDAWNELCLRNDLDLIYIATPRKLHAPMVLFSIKNDKHVACEIPIANSLDDIWQIVETSEKTKKHCMMLENCCYDFFELLTLNMVRQGFFGELIHADAGYLHDQLHMNFKKDPDDELWRVKESQHHNGNLYPTHGLGPVCQAMDINRGDRLDFMVSISSNDFQMGKMAAELAKEDSFYKQFDTNSYRGNMNTSIIRTKKGKTIMLQYDITSPRPYSRIHMISGTKGIARKYPSPERISDGHKWFDDEKMKEIWEKYTPEIVKRIGELAKKVGGHGGMDFMMDWRLIDCLRNGLPLDEDVYDAAAWSSIRPLSEWSVANNSNSIKIPDFTCGSYKTNVPVDINLTQGGNTGVKIITGTESEKQQKI